MLKQFRDKAGESAGGKDSESGLSRRSFLKVSAGVGGGLMLAVALPMVRSRAAEFAIPTGDLNAFVQVPKSGPIKLVMPYIEMGQGTYTSISMLIAEELEVGLDQIVAAHAPAAAAYGNPLIGNQQITGGSTAIRAAWQPMREAGAAARMMLIAAAAKRWEVEPSDCKAVKGEVVNRKSGKTFSYGEIADDAAALPVPKEVKLKSPKDFTLIGTPAKRVDTPAKVNGTAKFGIDAQVEGMKVATVAACPVFGGKLKSVDDSEARKVNGVVDIVTIENAVAVIGDHMGAAKKGLAALKIEWDEGPNADLNMDVLVRNIVDAAGGQSVVAEKEGDFEKAYKAAAKTHEADYHMPILAHATMEPPNCTVHVRKDGCDVWTGSQVMGRAKDTAVAETGLPPEKVTVHNHYLGGGFGRRLEFDYVTQAVKIAKQVDYPVKVIWTREEDIQHDIYRPYYFGRLKAGLDKDGVPVAYHHKVVGPSILARWMPPAFENGIDSDAVEEAGGPYSFGNRLIDYVRHEPPEGVMVGWWRGVGVTHNAFIVEGFIDELAAAAGKDPVAYRKAMLGDAPRAAAVLDLAAEKAGWGKDLGQGKGQGVSLLFGFGSYVAQIAEVEVAEDGSVSVPRIVCAVDCGQQVNPDTIKAQMEGGIIFGLTAALYGEITIEKGRVQQSNFDSYPMVRMDGSPRVEVHLVDSGEAPGGIGEPGTAGIAPAVVNGIFAATGKRLRKLPVDSDALKA